MVRIYKTIDGAIHQIQEPEEGCWIALTNPTATEIFEFSEKFDIEVDDLRSPLDEEERSRIEVEDNYTLILVDVPMIEERNDKDWYGTIPLGIIVTGSMIFTICLEDTPVLTRFMEGRVRSFFTYMKTRFIFQILYRNASMYLRYLRIIDKKSEQVEEKLHLSTRNEELIELLELQKSLTYFITSLRSNEVVLEKLLKIDSIKKYPEDTDLLEDVITENKQAIEMANVYSGILNGTMDAFASILYRNASMYLRYLHIIDKKSEQVEEKLHLSTRNEELIELLELQKSLTYFITSLRSNEVVLEKLLKIDSIKKYPEDTDLLEDVITENKQAIEMANVYSGILNGTMDAFASIISNNMNIVMKVLAIITIVMSIPTIVFSAYGMNVAGSGMPLSRSPLGFLIIILISVAISVVAAIILSKKRFF